MIVHDLDAARPRLPLRPFETDPPWRLMRMEYYPLSLAVLRTTMRRIRNEREENAVPRYLKTGNQR